MGQIRISMLKTCDNQESCGARMPMFANAALAYCVMAMVNGILTVSETYVRPMKPALEQIGGHFLIGHGVIVGAGLLIFTLVFRAFNLAARLRLGTPCVIRYVVLFTFLGALMVASALIY